MRLKVNYLCWFMTRYAHDTILPDQQSNLSKKLQVERMFDNISPRYDFLNRFLSLGIDKGWRRKALAELKSIQPRNILDVATGTGDVAIMAAKRLNPESITGIDISEKMLEHGREKVKAAGLEHKITLLKGDSETISAPAASFDAVTVAFGVRNFQHLEAGLAEIFRVLRPGGKLVVLEFSKPTAFWIKPFYQFYLHYVCPIIGRLISKDKTAYTYLNHSINKFPEGENFTRILGNTGFKNTFQKKLSFGICSIYCGEK